MPPTIPPTEKLHPVVLRPGRVINLSLPVFDELWIIDGRQFYHRPPMLNFLLKSPDPPPSTGSSETVRLDGATRIKLVRSSSRLWVEWALCKSDRHRTVYESNKGWPVTDDRRPPLGNRWIIGTAASLCRGGPPAWRLPGCGLALYTMYTPARYLW